MVCHFWGHRTHPEDRPAMVFKGPKTMPRGWPAEHLGKWEIVRSSRMQVLERAKMQEQCVWSADFWDTIHGNRAKVRMVCHFWGHRTHPEDRPAEGFKGPKTMPRGWPAEHLGKWEIVRSSRMQVLERAKMQEQCVWSADFWDTIHGNRAKVRMVCHFGGHHTHPEDRPAEVFKVPKTMPRMWPAGFRGPGNYAQKVAGRASRTGRSMGRTTAK